MKKINVGTIFKYNDRSDFVVDVYRASRIQHFGNKCAIKKNTIGFVIAPTKIDKDWWVYLNGKIGILRKISMETLNEVA